MAYIVSFAIEGLAGRKDTYAKKLDRHLNVFFGLNGSGKTSLLKILHSAMYGDEAVLRSVPFERAEVVIYSADYKREFTRTISRAADEPQEYVEVIRTRGMVVKAPEEVLAAPRMRTRRRWGWKMTPVIPKTSSTRWQHVYMPTWRLVDPEPRILYEAGFGASEERAREYDWDVFFANSLEQLWKEYSNELLGEIQTIQGKGLVNILKGVLATKSVRRKADDIAPAKAYERASAFLARQGARKILGAPEKFAKRYTADSQLRKVIADINAVESRIENARASRNKLEELIRGMFSGNKRVVFADNKIDIAASEGRKIGLASLSSGEKQALWIFIQTLLAKHSTLLIDEPEISLHIKWQEKLIGGMRQLNPDAQLILATHAPEIQAHVPNANIHRL